ncbi:MAG: division/cell wall cluster transcriptional repressor MraZ [Omnitrophica bacterium]|nr:division/cell wall cluster transcriptional repressor MraZ [Candidatus Omnitrophota bacterium]
MWYGEYQHTLDDKERFILPAKFREKLKTLDKKTLFVTYGFEGCLAFYPEATWREIETKVSSIPFTKKEGRNFSRLFYGGACEVEIDSQGRITLSERYKKFAQIKREIVIIGIGNRIEIWDKTRWDEFCRENKERFEEIAEDLFDG